LHVRNAVTVDLAVLELTPVRSLRPSHQFLDRVHVTVEHQRTTAAGAFDRSEDIEPVRVDVMLLDVDAHLPQAAEKGLADRILVAMDAGNPRDRTSEVD